jgi:hypothetical protein
MEITTIYHTRLPSVKGQWSVAIVTVVRLNVEPACMYTDRKTKADVLKSRILHWGKTDHDGKRENELNYVHKKIKGD